MFLWAIIPCRPLKKYSIKQEGGGELQIWKKSIWSDLGGKTGNWFYGETDKITQWIWKPKNIPMSSLEAVLGRKSGKNFTFNCKNLFAGWLFWSSTFPVEVVRELRKHVATNGHRIRSPDVIAWMGALQANYSEQEFMPCQLMQLAPTTRQIPQWLL